VASVPPIVRFRGVTKRFPGVTALSGVSLDIAPGTVHALCGENGAGKSTLGKILSGIEHPDEGTIEVDGRVVRFRSPADAKAAGIGMVYQELAFCENLTVGENLCLGDLPGKAGFVSRRDIAARATGLLDAIGVRLETERPVGDLTVGHQQLLQIAAAVGHGARVIVFDEPTSSLTQHEAEGLYRLVGRLKASGVTLVYVSHRLEEIFRLCDTVTVLRDGEVVGTRAAGELDKPALVHMMVGRALDDEPPAGGAGRTAGRELLRVEDLSSPGRFHGVSLSVAAGEIVGLAGLVGSGRTELAQAIFGLDPRVTGRVAVEGRTVRIRRPADAMREGLGLVPEDRKRHGLVLGMSARANITLSLLDSVARLGFVRARAEAALAEAEAPRLRLPASRLHLPVAGLSGGNQQKVVFARWLARRCRVLMLDEPTRGVDVAAKAEIHALVRALAADGRGVLLVSSELPELVRLAQRVLVLRHGRIAGEVEGRALEPDTVLRLMTGVAPANAG
jgi:ABC-type sugar transport system ATPase subunit